MWKKIRPYILYPVAFALLGCGALWLVVSPVLASFAPLMHSASGRALWQNQPIPSRFEQLEQNPAEPPRDTVDIMALGGWPIIGEEIGTLRVEGTLVDAALYYGDGTTETHYGVGIYPRAYIPGQGGTVLIAGHTATHFRDFESAEVGQLVYISTYYGDYVYEITGMQVAEATDTSAYDLLREEDNLIMYTCYPFGTLALTPERYFIYGELVEGPEITQGEGDTNG